MSGRVVLVGQPNVGKSVLFNRLTGSYSTVSNYPGTTVTISSGKTTYGLSRVEVVDTPGMYSLLPTSDEEKVARDIILRGEVSAVVHVVDGKNLRRMLPMTLALAELGLPLILVVNMIDEAERLGVFVDSERLSASLGIPVVTTAATKGTGIRRLREEILSISRSGRAAEAPGLAYDERIEAALSAAELKGEYRVSGRGLTLLLLQGDPDVELMVRRKEGSRYNRIKEVLERARASVECEGISVEYLVAARRFELADRLAKTCVYRSRLRSTSRGLLDTLTITPVTGIPIAIVVMYFVLYRFVGLFGAGYMVDLADRLFRDFLTPLLESFVRRSVPVPTLVELLVGEFGMLTLGLRYAVAIVLPIVGVFFLAFSLIEDSGYLPRIALLVDRLLKPLGLEGKAIVPLSLGLGCGTMAAMVTRTLSSRREQLIAILLLSLAVPCSAQLGVILAILSENPGAFAIWLGIVGVTFVAAGLAFSRLLSSRPRFSMEVPPLRFPSIRNVLWKSCARMQWYFLEVLPVFLGASVLVWLLKLSRLLDTVTGAMGAILVTIGLPRELAIAFVFGFLRRDYGAAGLYDYRHVMDGGDLLVSSVVLTLFVPCIAQTLVIVREKGIPTAVMIVAMSFVAAIGTGFALNAVLESVGVLCR